MDMVNRDARYQAVPGGSPYNMALAMARLGGEVAFLGLFSEDVFGRQLYAHIEENGVEMRWAKSTPLLTTLSFAFIGEDGGATYSIYLDNTSSCALSADDLADYEASPELVHLTSFALFVEPVAFAIDYLLGKVGGETLVSVDPNIRPRLVKDEESVRRRLEEMMGRADILKSSDEDLAWLNPEASPEGFCEEWSGRGVSLVVVTFGGEGAVLKGRAGMVRVPTPQIQVSDTVGAGDTFQAGLLTWLQEKGKLTREGLDGLTLGDLSAMGSFAACAAAITCSRTGCNPPFRKELAGYSSSE